MSARMNGAGALTGTGELMRLILRRDRIALICWILLLGLLPLGLAASFVKLYPNPQALAAFAHQMTGNPTTVGMLGFVYSPTLGGLVAWRSGLQTAFLLIPVTMLLLIRHTRSEEFAGRRELLSAAPVGRHAALTAALGVMGGSCLMIGLLIAGGLIGIGLPPAGALALGLSAIGGGWVFTALAAVVAQLSESPGPARILALSAFGIGFGLRTLGDTSGQAWLSWISPLGWIRLTRAFAGEQWGVLGLFAALTVALTGLAYWLSARRDAGAGLLPQSQGKEHAAPWLARPLALTWRLQRAGLIGWACAAAAIGGLTGSVSRSLSSFADNPQVKAWLQGIGAHSSGESFLFMLMYIFGQVVAVYAILQILRLRSEEASGQAEPLLTNGVNRQRWAGANIAFALAGPALMLGMLGIFAGLASGDIGANLPRFVARSLTTLPAIWVLTAFSAALWGWAPRIVAAGSWVVLALCGLLELGWEMRQLSQTVFNLTPFAYVHWTIQAQPLALLMLSLLAAALIALGLIGLSRRDIG